MLTIYRFLALSYKIKNEKVPVFPADLLLLVEQPEGRLPL
jgi:hypothetical protein